MKTFMADNKNLNIKLFFSLSQFSDTAEKRHVKQLITIDPISLLERQPNKIKWVKIKIRNVIKRKKRKGLYMST